MKVTPDTLTWRDFWDACTADDDQPRKAARDALRASEAGDQAAERSALDRICDFINSRRN